MGFWDLFRATPAPAAFEVFASGKIAGVNARARTAQIVLHDGARVSFSLDAFNVAGVVGSEVVVRLAVRGATSTVVDVRPRPPPLANPLFLRPLHEVSSWGLACKLVDGSTGSQGDDAAAPLAEARAAVVAELTNGRGKTSAEVEEMREAVRWAHGILNPPGAAVHQVVGDAYDLELAVEAAAAGGEAAAAERMAAVVARHRD